MRKIRSYVRREGRITKAQNQALHSLWPHYGLSTKEGMLSFERVFSRKAPVVLEIGFGSGESLAEMARQQPETNYVGVEVHRPGIGGLLLRIEEEGLKNVRIFQEDVIEVLAKSVCDEALSGVQIFFPDPWPKKRHHKRRLIQRPFLDVLSQKLQPGGRVHVATDWEPYAEQVESVFEKHADFDALSDQEKVSQLKQLRPSTKFERRGQRLGHQIADLLFVKKNPGP